MKIALLVVGDEILLGQVTDSNAARIGQLLYARGLGIAEKLTVGDSLEEIRRGLGHLAEHARVILVSGGLGPTLDDLTQEALAGFAGRPLVENPEAKSNLLALLERRGRPVNAIQLRQCRMPEGAEVLPNAMGTAPGTWLEHDQKVFIAMPGVPYELETMLQNQVLPRLERLPRSGVLLHRTLLTGGIAESDLAARVESWAAGLPPEYQLAYLPALGTVRLRLTATLSRERQDAAGLDAHFEAMTHLLEDAVVARGDVGIEDRLGEILLNNKLGLSTAESCTGGSISKRITSVAGASQYYRGGLVCYQNDVKISTLSVPATLLETEGAVSEACVRAMVEGALDAFKADVAMSTSGIAGPGGGSPGKPVGTVWLACGDAAGIEAKCHHFPWDRHRNIEAATAYSLLHLWKFLRQRGYC
ncbi:MAG: CinA family nicotinamide mononucleotide deamidase-related protein [Saprospiraceae bacterium]|nr:CinA family nicotinamide mononucleotide deamidase-related protein [Saprospiraceae bacterium]